MKTTVTILVLLGALVAGGIVYHNHRQAQPVAAPATPSSESASAAPARPDAQKPVENPAAAPAIVSAAQVQVTPAAAAPAPSNGSASKNKNAEALLSAKSAAEKHELFQQILKAGQIDAVIADLKQRALENPTDPEIPTTLGEAQLNKLKALHDAGADTDEMGILAMQADQSFNAALKVDPQNWEAQFVKVSSMYYWPSTPERDNDVVQRLSSLIDQQESTTVQPEFAQTYVVLGNEYQKIGQPDKAMATWQLGAQKFPNDPSLQKKLTGQ